MVVYLNLRTRLILINIINMIKDIDSLKMTLMFILLILSGSINTLADKFQNQQLVEEHGHRKYFYHPYISATVVCIGDMMAFPLYYFLKKKDPKAFEQNKRKAQLQGKQIQFNKNKISISAICSLIASTFQCISLNFIVASSYQMMRGGTIATNFLFSRFYLKKQANKYQYFGSLLIIIGVVIIGIQNMVYSQIQTQDQYSTNPNLQIAGYVLLMISIFFNGFQYTYEEHLFEKYHIEPMLMVAYQGLYGLILNLVIVVIFTYLPCFFGVEACVLTDQGAYFQRADVFFRELGQNSLLLVFCIVSMISILVLNVTGLSITKQMSALTRAVCDETRAVIIWIVGITITLTAGAEQQNYDWQRTQGGSIGCQIAGFFTIFLGNLVYNQMLLLSCLNNKTSSNQTIITENFINNDEFEQE